MRIALISTLAVLQGCATQQAAQKPEDTTLQAPSGGKAAFATLLPKSGTTTGGTAEFVEKDGQITLTLRVNELGPGKHAAHLHETGDCSDAEAKLAGGHWNPTTDPHGKWAHGEHHLGDIGNIDVGADNKGELTLTTDKWSIGTGQPNDIVGKAVVVHADPDDFTSQPAGNAGKRVACGVVALK